MKIEIRHKDEETQEFKTPEGKDAYQSLIRRRGAGSGPNSEYRYGLLWGSRGVYGGYTVYLTEAEFHLLVTQLVSFLLEADTIANWHNDAHFEEYCARLFGDSGNGKATKSEKVLEFEGERSD